jgi:hypothetical protein
MGAHALPYLPKKDEDVLAPALAVMISESSPHLSAEEVAREADRLTHAYREGRERLETIVPPGDRGFLEVVESLAPVNGRHHPRVP